MLNFAEPGGIRAGKQVFTVIHGSSGGGIAIAAQSQPLGAMNHGGSCLNPAAVDYQQRAGCILSKAAGGAAATDAGGGLCLQWQRRDIEFTRQDEVPAVADGAAKSYG